MELVTAKQSRDMVYNVLMNAPYMYAYMGIG